MAHSYYHAVSSAKKWKGKPEDYLAIHQWFDASKAYFSDYRHRALRHHSEGIFACEEKFGALLVNSDGYSVPVRAIGEQHVLEDLGRIPTLQDWFSHIPPQPWMRRSERLSQSCSQMPDHAQSLESTPSPV